MQSRCMRGVAATGVALLLAGCGGGGDGPTGSDGIASVSLNAPSLDMLVGRTEQLVATAKDAQGNTVAGAPAATWKSSNTSVVTVTATGAVTAVIVGSATVTATIGSKSKALPVTVTVAATNVTVSMPGLTFAPFRAIVRQGGTVNYAFPSLAHNVIFDRISGAPTDIPGQVSNSTVSRTFPTAGLFRYHCSLHNGMDGEVEAVP